MMPSVFARGAEVVVGYEYVTLLAAICAVKHGYDCSFVESAVVPFPILEGHLGCAVARCGIVLIITDFVHCQPLLALQDYHVRGEDCCV